MILDLSMQNTDSVWKRRMKLLSEDAELCRNGYWLNPFRNFKADCPYLVGDYERVAGMIVQLITRGVDMFIIDLPADEREFHHLHAAFSLAKQQLIA